MNLGRKGANKAQERAQTLAHGHPWGLGRSLTVIPLSLLHVGSHGVEAWTLRTASERHRQAPSPRIVRPGKFARGQTG